MKGFLREMNHRVLVRTTLFVCLALICVVWLPASAQRTVRSPNQDESDGVRVGGKWVEFHSEDKMTASRKVRFELLADNYLSEDPDYKPRIELVCTNGKYSYADFNPGIRLGPPNRPGFWGQPQLEVLVRVDDAHGYHGWNWIRDHFLSMDKRPFPLHGQRHDACFDRSPRLQSGNPWPERPRNRGVLT